MHLACGGGNWIAGQYAYDVRCHPATHPIAAIRAVRRLRLVHRPQRRYEVVLLRHLAPPAGHVVATLALAADHVAVVVERAARIAVAQAAAVGALRQTVRVLQTLVAVLAAHVPLARALAGVHVAAGIVVRAERVARAALAAVRIVGAQVPEALAAHVALPAVHVRLAVARAGDGVAVRIADRVAHAVVQRADRVAFAGCSR